MKKRLTLICITALSFIGAPMPAEAVNKCTGKDGRISYQDKPCPDKGESVKIVDNLATQGDGFWVGEYSSRSRLMDSTSSAADRHSAPSHSASVRGGDGVVHTGPRGGKYTITSGGNKRYLPRE